MNFHPKLAGTCCQHFADPLNNSKNKSTMKWLIRIEKVINFIKSGIWSGKALVLFVDTYHKLDECLYKRIFIKF